MSQTGTVTPAKLNLRSTPDASGAGNVIKQLAQGTQIEIVEQVGDWLKVSVGAQQGFVSAAFVRQQTAATDADAQADGIDASAGVSDSASLGGGANANQPAPVGLPLASGPAPAQGACKFVGNNALAPDGTVFAKRFKLGVFSYGATSIGQFVAAHQSFFPDISPSRLRVMQAVSANEGKLEAINTWDNAFLTFGCFQWTVGTGTGAGELPAMLDRLKKRDASVFQKYFGQFGLDTVIPKAAPNTLPTGFFSLNGATLNSPAQKGQLRTLDWAYRFWLAGHDDTVRLVEIEHAMSRVDLFYRCPRCLINTRFVGDYVSSEYGIALLLDQHVNRPGNVPQTLARAVATLVSQLGADTPQGWQDAQEQRLIALYLQQRALTTMTNSNERAQSILAAVNSGLASRSRGSFQA
jgi:hypothetical protein